ncbi:unnamed protein product [Anisakis simplex]|uniref:Cyanocobalamin reductase (cyanide-eliminating) n=1 Tax=Anisakis simplex TaxID=6269 RepID=A0A0M3KK48_ANISI|nr:unnamed protein product [Anisakis simplex]
MALSGIVSEFVGPYNAVVQEGVRLNYPDNTLAVLVLNTPSFFGKTFKAWLLSHWNKGESVEDVKRKVGAHPIESFFNWKFEQIEKVSLVFVQFLIQYLF